MDILSGKLVASMKTRTKTRDQEGSHHPAYPGTPRWVKVFGIIAIGLILLIVIIVFTGVGGPHSPGRHFR